MKRIEPEKMKKGFTLIELMIVIAISAIILLGAFSFFTRQQTVFDQQSEQAEKQANLRIALYYLAKDIALAGYTGTPWGVEAAIKSANQAGVSIPIRPLKHIDVATDPELSSYLLLNRNSEPLDAIEVWANFNETGAYTHLSGSVNMGASSLYANTVEDGIFVSQIWDEATSATKEVNPTGAVIGSYSKMGDYLPISSIDKGGKQINSSGVSLNRYYGGDMDVVAPVLKRRYFVREYGDCPGPRCERWLIQRSYYADGPVDNRMAMGIQDFQIFYDLTDPGSGQFVVEVDPALADSPFDSFDPCWVTAVTIRLQAIVRTKDLPQPLITNLSRKIKVMNIGVQSDLANCTCPIGDPDCASFAGP